MKKKSSIILLIMVPLILFSQNFDGYKIYLWDNDYSMTFPNPDNTQSYIGYEYNLLKAFNKIGFRSGVNLFEADTMPKTYTKLSQYAAIFIVSGYAPVWSRTPLFTQSEIDTLAKYLDWGGCLYLEGNNVIQFLRNDYPLFLSKYFNDSLYEDNDYMRNVDTLRTDPATSFCRYYRFDYPEGTESDSGVDVMNTRDATLREPNYYRVLYYESDNKLYKSTATAYTPPDTKDKAYYFKGKTFLQTVDLGAFSYTTMSRTERPLPDTLKSQYIRMAYIKDILRFFGLARTLIVVDDGLSAINTAIDAALDRMDIDYDSVCTPGGVNGPDDTLLMKYTSVIWYTDTMNTTLNATDTTNLGIYMDYGGNLFLSSDNLAERLGVEDTFLKNYLGVGFIDDSVGNDSIFASPQSFYLYNDVADTVVIARPSSGYEPDVIKTLNADGDSAYFMYSGARTKYCVGTRYSPETHNSVFFTFPFQRAKVQYKAGYPVDSILKITLKVYFDYDLNFEPHDVTGATAVNCAYSIIDNKIKFSVYIENPLDGKVVLVEDGKNIDESVVFSNINTYSLKGSKNYGGYLIKYLSAAGEEYDSKELYIPKSGKDYESVYILNDILYIISSSNAEYELFDISGKFIDRFNAATGLNSYDKFKEFSSGVYFIRKADSTVFNKKIIKLF